MAVNLRRTFNQAGFVSLRNVLTVNEKKMIKDVIYENFKQHIKLIEHHAKGTGRA